jgi:hypothetical protein
MTSSTPAHSSDAATGLITGVQPVRFMPNPSSSSTIALPRVTSRSCSRKPRQDLGRGAAVAVTGSVSDALPRWAPWAEQPAVTGAVLLKDPLSTVRWRPMTGRLTVGGARSALPAEGLISAALARSTAKASPAVYSAWSTPPLNPVISRPPHLCPTYPLELSKLRVEHTWCTAGTYPQVVTTRPASRPLGKA